MIDEDFVKDMKINVSEDFIKVLEVYSEPLITSGFLQDLKDLLVKNYTSLREKYSDRELDSSAVYNIDQLLSFLYPGIHFRMSIDVSAWSGAGYFLDLIINKMKVKSGFDSLSVFEKNLLFKSIFDLVETVSIEDKIFLTSIVIRSYTYESAYDFNYFTLLKDINEGFLIEWSLDVHGVTSFLSPYHNNYIQTAWGKISNESCEK